MSRLMSVALTEQAVRDQTKTVTRRLGWLSLRPGDRLTLCKKVMGRKRNEPLDRIAEVEVVSVRRELLRDITPADVAREGFHWPDIDTRAAASWFIDYFCASQRCTPNTEVTRIEWRYL